MYKNHLNYCIWKCLVYHIHDIYCYLTLFNIHSSIKILFTSNLSLYAWNYKRTTLDIFFIFLRKLFYFVQLFYFHFWIMSIQATECKQTSLYCEKHFIQILAWLWLAYTNNIKITDLCTVTVLYSKQII